MPAALVRAHTKGESAAAGSTIAATIVTANVAIGNVLVAWVAARDGVTVTGLSKPVGETAAWTKIGSHINLASGEMWAIKTTVAWNTGTAVTATFSGTANRRAILLAEFTGVDAAVRVAGASGIGTSGTAAASIAAGVLAGDVVLGGGAQATLDFADDIALDGDTAGGPWVEASSSEFRTGAGDDVALTTTLQYKVAATGAAQTFNVVTTNGAGGAITGQDVGATIAVLKSTNVAPNAPALTSMASGGPIDRTTTNRASHAFSDPNPGDSQSAFELRYKLVASSTWTTVSQTTPNQFYDFPPGTFAAGDYERQVRTYDSLGVEGPWSPSGFFTAADPPTGPTFTNPLNGSTVEASEVVTWSVPNQTSYQLRRVADVAGAPDTGTVYFDTGEVVDAAARSALATFPTNGRDEHLQLRTKYAGLWSSWVSVQVDVDYSPPPVPVVVLSADEGTASILVTVINPAPTGDEPAAAYNDIYVDDGDGEERKATQQPTNTPWRYWTPVSGRDYADAVRVVAVAANGTSSSS